MSFAENNSFTSSFPIWMPFIYFSCWIALARSSSTMLKRNGNSGCLYLVPHLRGKTLKLPSSLTSCDVSDGLIVAFIMRYILICWLHIQFVEFFFFAFIMKVYYTFLCLLSWYGFHLLFYECEDHIYWFAYIESSLHPRDKSHLIMVFNLFNVLLNLVC